MKQIMMIVAVLGLTMLTGCAHSHMKNDKACAECAGKKAQSGCAECGDKAPAAGCPDCKKEAKK